MSDPGPDPIGWHHNPSYCIDFDPLPARVQAVLAGGTVADTTAARGMYELGHAPVYYLPREDVNMALLEPTDRDTYCPYKGHASYWTVRVGTRTAENAIWSYEIPHRELAQVSGYMGFYWGRMDAWLEDGVEARDPGAHRRRQPAQGAVPAARRGVASDQERRHQALRVRPLQQRAGVVARRKRRRVAGPHQGPGAGGHRPARRRRRDAVRLIGTIARRLRGTFPAMITRPYAAVPGEVRVEIPIV